MKKLILVVALVAAALPGAEPEKPLDFFLTQEVFPHIAIGGAWSTSITLVNLEAVATQFPLHFWATNGEPWVVTDTVTGISASTFSVTLEALQYITVELASPGSETRTGWAEVEQPIGSTIGGHAIFRDAGGPGRPIPFEAVVPLSTFAEGSTSLLDDFRISLFPFDQTRGFNTCIALANSSEFFGTTVALLTPDGTPLGQDIFIGPRGQTSFCFRGLLPLEGQRGVIIVGRAEADLTLSVVGFRFDPQGAFTTFFPMSKL